MFELLKVVMKTAVGYQNGRKTQETVFWYCLDLNMGTWSVSTGHIYIYIYYIIYISIYTVEGDRLITCLVLHSYFVLQSVVQSNQKRLSSYVC